MIFSKVWMFLLALALAAAFGVAFMAPKPAARGSRKATKRGGVDWGQRIREAEARLQGAKTDLAQAKEARRSALATKHEVIHQIKGELKEKDEKTKSPKPKRKE